MAVLSILLIVVIPYLSFHLLEKHVVNEAIISFNSYGVVLDSVFTSEFLENPKSIEGFEFDRLLDLSDQLEIDISDIIRKSKEPYGSMWLLSGFTKILTTLIYNLGDTIYSAYAKHRIIASILSILGFLFVFILGKELLKKQKLIKDNDPYPPILSKFQKVYRIIFSQFVMTAIISYSIFYFIKNLITFIKYPAASHYTQVDTTTSFYFESIVILMGIVILILILVTLIKRRSDQSNNYLALFWTVTVLAIGVNIYLDNFQISMLNTMLDTQNRHSIRMKSIEDCTEIAYSARQWFLQNAEQTNLEEFLQQDIVDFQSLKNENYQVSVEDNILTITGIKYFADKVGSISKVVVSYYPAGDSIHTEIDVELLE